MEKGKLYQVKHKRKGNFQIKIIDEDENFVIGIIVSGVADAFLEENIKRKGDYIKLHKVQAQFKKIE